MCVRTLVKTDTVVGRRNAVRPTHGASRPAAGGSSCAPSPFVSAPASAFERRDVCALDDSLRIRLPTSLQSPSAVSCFSKCFAAEEAARKRREHNAICLHLWFRFASPCDGNWMPSVWRTPQSVSIDAELEAVALLNNCFFLVIKSSNRS